MKKTFKSLFAVLLPIMIFTLPTYAYSSEPWAGENSTRDEVSIDNLKKASETVKGILIIEGWSNGESHKFDISTLTDEMKDLYAKFGVSKALEKIESVIEKPWYCEVLAKYFFSDLKDYKRALYYAFEGAYLGNEGCMAVLAFSHAEGLGVVQDIDETFKWLYLGSALGEENCRKLVMEAVDDKIAVEGRKRAQEWMKDHPKLFFSP